MVGWILIGLGAAVFVALRERYHPLRPAVIRKKRIELAQERMSRGEWELALALLVHIESDITGRELPDVGCLHAQCLLQLDRAREARELLRALVGRPATKPVDASQRWYWLGEAHTALNQISLARPAYEGARAADPDGVWAKRAEARLAGGAAYR